MKKYQKIKACRKRVPHELGFRFMPLSMGFCILGCNKMLTQERVKELFDYKNGDLIRKIKVPGGVEVGMPAGYKNVRGYIVTMVDRKLYQNHRLVWMWHYGYLPENHLDHIDQNCSNNRIENLREASQSCNMRNSRQQKTATMVKGIREEGGNYRVRIVINKKQYHIGYTSCILEAACIRLSVEQCVNWAGCDKTSPAYLFVKKHIPIK